ncbi:MAG TPA: MIP family channel protein [Gemmatimonadales bacterium]|nr:MIP family channel protein [Gemmatimonadales bacterium]
MGTQTTMLIGPRLLAEGIGTFMLVVIGPGAAAVDLHTQGGVTHVGVALSFAFVILAGVYALGHISGAHFNPAVTMGFWLSGRFPRGEVLAYTLAQLTGAAAGALLLRLTLGAHVQAAVTVPRISIPGALLIEIVLTFFLMLVIMAVATDHRVASPAAGLAVGLTVGFDAMMGGPLTGASMNPARSFGPALAAGSWTAHWLYWLGPLLGAALAVLTYGYLRKGEAHDYRVQSPAASADSLHR